MHLIHRQRYPERPFTTLRFFDKTVKHNVLRQHLIDRVLLVLRVLALAALFVGLARPFWSLPLGERRRAVVILLDNSPSMARVSAGKPLFEHAREAAGRVLAHLEAGDQVALVLTSPQGDPEFKTDKRTLQRELAAQAGTPLALWTAGEQGRPYARPGLTTDAAALAQALQAMPSGISAAWVGYGGTTPEPVLEYGTARAGAALARARISAVPGELRTAMRAAARVLRRCSEGDSRMVVLSDMQKSEWRQPVADVGGMGITLVSVDTPNETVNLAVEGVLLPEREVWLGPNIVGSATICNRGNKASSAAELIVTAGDVDEPGQTTRVPVPALLPGGREQVNFPLHVMTRHRDLLCSAEVRGGGDDFPYDNTWYFQLRGNPRWQRVHMQADDNARVGAGIQHAAELAADHVELQRVVFGVDQLIEKIDLKQAHTCRGKLPQVLLGQLLPCPAPARRIRQRVEHRNHGLVVYQQGRLAIHGSDAGGICCSHILFVSSEKRWGRHNCLPVQPMGRQECVPHTFSHPHAQFDGLSVSAMN